MTRLKKTLNQLYIFSFLTLFNKSLILEHKSKQKISRLFLFYIFDFDAFDFMFDFCVYWMMKIEKKVSRFLYWLLLG